MLKYLTSTALALALSLGGAAYAETQDKAAPSARGGTAVYKESQWKAIPRPVKKKSVEQAGAPRRDLYQDWVQQSRNPVNPASIEPSADEEYSVYGIE